MLLALGRDVIELQSSEIGSQEILKECFACMRLHLFAPCTRARRLQRFTGDDLGYPMPAVKLIDGDGREER